MTDQFDLGGLLQQAQQMQQRLMDAQQEVNSQEVEGHAGGGAVRVTVTGGMEFRSVRIDPAAVDPQDVTILEDLVLAALHDAVAKAQALSAEAMGDMSGLAGDAEGGLAGLGGLFGGGLGAGGDLLPDDEDEDGGDVDDDDADDVEDGGTTTRDDRGGAG